MAKLCSISVHVSTFEVQIENADETWMETHFLMSK